MLTATAIIPSAPVLVPQLAGVATAELAELRAAVFEAVAALPSRWLAVGVGAADVVLAADTAGTFGGYGVDVRVRMSRRSDIQAPSELPLCALITGWVREHVAPQAQAEVRVFAHDHDVEAATEHGSGMRAAIDATTEPVGVLVVADGAHTLALSAPGGHHPDSIAVQNALDDALATGNPAALAAVPPAVSARVAWHVLAGLAGAGPRSAEQLYRGAPYGVGYFTGVWHF